MQLVAQSVACLPFLGDNTRFFSVGTPGVKSADITGRRFCRFYRSSNGLLDSLLTMFLRARRWLVGACVFHIQPAKQTFANEHNVSIPNYFRFTHVPLAGSGTAELTSDCLRSEDT